MIWYVTYNGDKTKGRFRLLNSEIGNDLALACPVSRVDKFSSP